MLSLRPLNCGGNVYKKIEGKFEVRDKKVAIVVSRWNEFVVSKLLDGAIDAFGRHNLTEDITVVYSPGSFELPFIAQKLAMSKKYDAIVCLGAVIRGGTPHFDYISAEVTKGIANVGLNTGVPCIFGILTTDTMEQAIERAGMKAGNKGFDAAMAAIEIMSLMEQI